MKYLEIAILTVIIGYAGDALLGNFLNWPSAGMILRHSDGGGVPAAGD